MLPQWKDCQSLTAPRKYHVEISCSSSFANWLSKSLFTLNLMRGNVLHLCAKMEKNSNNFDVLKISFLFSFSNAIYLRFLKYLSDMELSFGCYDSIICQLFCY